MSEPKEESNDMSRRNSDVMIARIDERTENLSRQLEAVQKEVRFATEKMSKEIQQANAIAAAAVEEAKKKAEAAVKEVTDHIGKSYVTKDEFNPVKAIAYGLVGLVCVAVLAAVVALVIRTDSGSHFEVTTQPGARVAVDQYHNEPIKK